jgi:hypothetical protein
MLQNRFSQKLTEFGGEPLVDFCDASFECFESLVSRRIEISEGDFHVAETGGLRLL